MKKPFLSVPLGNILETNIDRDVREQSIRLCCGFLVVCLFGFCHCLFGKILKIYIPFDLEIPLRVFTEKSKPKRYPQQKKAVNYNNMFCGGSDSWRPYTVNFAVFVKIAK